MAWQCLTESDGSKIDVNLALVRTIRQIDQGTAMVFDKDHLVLVKETAN